MAKVAQFEKGKTVVFGPEGFARVESIGEKVVLGNKVTVVDLFVLDSKMNVTVPLTTVPGRMMRSTSRVRVLVLGGASPSAGKLASSEAGGTSSAPAVYSSPAGCGGGVWLAAGAVFVTSEASAFGAAFFNSRPKSSTRKRTSM